MSSALASRLPGDLLRCAAGLWHERASRALKGIAIACLLGIAGISPVYGASDGLICNGCQLSFGIGDTYHFWSRTGGLVVPITFTSGEGRYELGAFRFTTAQKLYEDQWGCTHVLAEPYWGVSASRRWRLVTQPTWRLFFGFGVSYKFQEDALNSTHWNFASSVGVRLRHPGGKVPRWSLRCATGRTPAFALPIADRISLR